MLDLIKTSWNAFFQDRRGVTAVEYAVIAALIIGTVATAFTSLASKISSELGTVSNLM
jgi:Flp pilus assembly pilin Flp